MEFQDTFFVDRPHKEENGEPNDANLVEDFASVDGDSCTTKEINNQFFNRYVEVYDVRVTKGDVSCTRLLADDHSANIASVLSDRNVVVVDRQTFKVIKEFPSHKKEVTDLRFSPTSSNIVYTSSLNGTIKMWDSRSGIMEKKLVANTGEGEKPITTFDISLHERLVCAGTELIGEDSFLLFWDLRNSKLLGGYWKSHSDDISCIRFNPNESETVASAGTDGLLNIFDLSQPSEDNALTYCLNAEATIHTLCWRNENKKSVLTYTDYHSVQLWDVQEAVPSHTFSRENITKALRRNISYECYPIPLSCTMLAKNPIILAGSGLEYEGHTCLRTLVLNERSGCLEPHGLLVCKNDCHLSSITQIASLSQDSEEIITVREDGHISLWRKKT